MCEFPAVCGSDGMGWNEFNEFMSALNWRYIDLSYTLEWIAIVAVLNLFAYILT